MFSYGCGAPPANHSESNARILTLNSMASAKSKTRNPSGFAYRFAGTRRRRLAAAGRFQLLKEDDDIFHFQVGGRPDHRARHPEVALEGIAGYADGVLDRQHVVARAADVFLDHILRIPFPRRVDRHEERPCTIPSASLISATASRKACRSAAELPGAARKTVIRSHR